MALLETIVCCCRLELRPLFELPAFHRVVGQQYPALLCLETVPAWRHRIAAPRVAAPLGGFEDLARPSQNLPKAVRKLPMCRLAAWGPIAGHMQKSPECFCQSQSQVPPMGWPELLAGLQHLLAKLFGECLRALNLGML